jgi:flagellar basal-body rod modification protein FlgD
MKSENMMQQLAAMGTVEQLQNLNNQTSQLMTLQQDISRATSANLIGKDVEIGSQSLGITKGDISPAAYRLTGDANRVQVMVHDSGGEVIRKYHLENQPQGSHKFIWDGRDNEGDLMPDGRYHYNVYAKTESGEDISVSYSKKGQVSMIRFEGANPMVQVNGEWLHGKDIIGIDDASSQRYGSAIPLPIRNDLESRRPNFGSLDQVQPVQLDE